MKVPLQLDRVVISGGQLQITSRRSRCYGTRGWGGVSYSCSHSLDATLLTFSDFEHVLDAKLR